MKYDFNKRLEECLEIDEFALLYAKADEAICKHIERIYYSRFRVFWKIYYSFVDTFSSVE